MIQGCIMQGALFAILPVLTKYVINDDVIFRIRQERLVETEDGDTNKT